MAVLGVLLWVLAIALGAVAIGTVLLYARRRQLQRSGGFDLCLRLTDQQGWSGGWVFGVGRYRGDRLEWFRTFSLGLRPGRVVVREQLEVGGRRELTGEETFELPAGHVVLEWRLSGETVEASMDRGSATALLAWVESAPPGLYF